MNVERRVLRSISEFSMFKYVLVSYLIFFILFVIVFAVIGLIGWAILASSGIAFTDILNSLMPGMNIPDILSSMGINLGGGVLGIVIFIIIGLVASVFAAAFAALCMWIFNVILRITGGIELRFAPGTIASHQFTGNAKPEEKTANNAKKQAVLEEQASSEQNQISRVEDYNLGN